MSHVPKRGLVILAVASVLATVGTVWLAVKAWGELPGWMLAAAASPLAMRCLTIMVVGLVALGVVLALLVRARPRVRPAGVRGFHGDQGGTAAVEMAMVFPLALMIFLLIIQAALVFNANLVVHYAAFAAARVAVVVVPLNLPNDGTWPEKRNWVRNPDVASVPASEKMEMIRRAAVLAVMPVSAMAASGAATTGPGGTSTVTGQTVQNESSTVFKHLGVNERPWFYFSQTKPSYEGFFSRAAAQYDYANGEISTQAGPIQVTKIELAKPWHWSHGRDEHCPYAHTRRGDWTDWGWNWISYCPTEVDNGVPDARMDYDYDHWGWHDHMWHNEQLQVRLTYQYLLEMPYANRFIGDEVQVTGRTGKQYATQIQVEVTLSNEGEHELKPRDYTWPPGT
jgi:Flp pilus assembly protein TadG